MKTFEVWPTWFPDDDRKSSGKTIEAYDAEQAAEMVSDLMYVEWEYPREVEVKVLARGRPIEEAEVFEVSVEEILRFYARLK